MDYQEFLNKKIIEVQYRGFRWSGVNPICKPHQKDVVEWSLLGGTRAIFCSFGLGKTVMQLEIAKAVLKRTGRDFLIGIPLGVLQEFREDAKMLGLEITYVREQSEITGEPGIYISNYERIRDGKFNPEYFGGVSFDEGDAIRNLDTQTTDYIMKEFSKVPFKFIATATPSPNEFTEILNYAQFLGIMDRGQALTRFFQRDSTKAGNLTLYPQKEKEFWFWVRSWAIFIEYPSDLGYDDSGYKLPKLNVFEHMVSVKDRGDIHDRDGNMKMFADASKGLTEAAKEKRESLLARVEKAANLVKSDYDSNWVIWHDLEDERKAIEQLLPEVKSVFGSQRQEVKESLLIDFKHGRFKYLATKPQIAGSGCNFQHHCNNAVFTGIGYKFKDFIQAVHRIYRFMQKHEVNIHLVFTDAEQEILKVLMEKWSRHKLMMGEMTALIKKYGLSHEDINEELRRAIGVEREVVEGQNFKFIHNDSTIEVKKFESDSMHMILTSIPFSDQYEYSENYADYGHNNGDEEFFKQMDYLTPELLRITQPGRIAAIHVKDRIVFSYQNGVGFTSLNDFSGKTVAHFVKHGWHLLAKHDITTDVVRENASTYRLGWTEACKDMTKMGCGSPEYLLIFRKAPTDTSNAYADVKVSKSKEEYTRARWQLDAHAYWRSNGNRLLTPEELRDQNLKQISAWWKQYSKDNPYDYETHVELCESLDKAGKLPSSFMTVPPQSNSPFVWDDVSRMRTLNTNLSQKKKEKHVCPLQFDIVDRAIRMYTNEGETVYDPFGGVGTVPYRCIKLNRFGVASELNRNYFRDGVAFCREAEYKNSVPTLFDALAS